MSDVRLERNARQGLSVVGAADLRAERCVFAGTGTGSFTSPPGAGVDLEPEDSFIRDVAFESCRFANNRGPGLIADTGTVSGVRITDCDLQGSPTAAALWPRAAAVVVDRCSVSGWVVNAFGSPDPALATRFVDCRIGRSLFLDDPTTRERLDGCVIEHHALLRPGDYQALLRGTSIARSRFSVQTSSPHPDPGTWPSRACRLALTSSSRGPLSHGDWVDPWVGSRPHDRAKATLRRARSAELCAQ